MEEKATYIPPEIRVEWVEMESAISAGSAIATPVNSDDQIQEDWDTDQNRDGSMGW